MCMCLCVRVCARACVCAYVLVCTAAERVDFVDAAGRGYRASTDSCRYSLVDLFEVLWSNQSELAVDVGLDRGLGFRHVHDVRTVHQKAGRVTGRTIQTVVSETE